MNSINLQAQIGQLKQSIVLHLSHISWFMQPTCCGLFTDIWRTPQWQAQSSLVKQTGSVPSYLSYLQYAILFPDKFLPYKGEAMTMINSLLEDCHREGCSGIICSPSCWKIWARRWILHWNSIFWLGSTLQCCLFTWSEFFEPVISLAMM